MKKDEQKIIYEKDGENANAVDFVEKIKKIKEKLKRCNEEKQEYLEGWQRAKADLINYRRRQEEKMAEWIKLANENLIIDILPVLDGLGLESRDGTRNYAERDAELRGVAMIRRHLLDILTNYGLEEIKAVGEKFNPELHEAVERVESDEEGIIMEEIQKGYLLNGKVIRTSKVRVTK